MMQNIEELDGVVGVAQLAARRQPAIIRNYVSSWPSVKKSLISDLEIIEYLERYSSGSEVVVYTLPANENGKFFYTDDLNKLNFSSSRKRLSQVLGVFSRQDYNSRSDTYYVGSSTIDKYLPEFRLENDVDLEFDSPPMVSLWLGNESTVAAHFDAPNNIACCVAGKRRFTLFPPDQIKNLYVGPLHRTPSGQVISLADLNDPDYSKYPKLEIALKYAQEAVLYPGDAIYIPSMWWHQVESLAKFNVLVNYWWRNVPKFKGPGIDALMHAILNIRDLPIEERDAWKSIFDYYIFSEQDGKFDHIPKEARNFLGELDDLKARQLRAWLTNKLNR